MLSEYAKYFETYQKGVESIANQWLYWFGTPQKRDATLKNYPQQVKTLAQLFNNTAQMITDMHNLLWTNEQFADVFAMNVDKEQLIALGMPSNAKVVDFARALLQEWRARLMYVAEFKTMDGYDAQKRFDTYYGKVKGGLAGLGCSRCGTNGLGILPLLIVAAPFLIKALAVSTIVVGGLAAASYVISIFFPSEAKLRMKHEESLIEESELVTKQLSECTKLSGGAASDCVANMNKLAEGRAEERKVGFFQSLLGVASNPFVIVSVGAIGLGALWIMMNKKR